ncbi:MAG: gamma-glutamylcyclotransferase, partial [Pseudomonadota bacterium]
PITLEADEAGEAEPAEAICYILDRTHPQYCDLDLAAQAAIIAVAEGPMGPNAEYLHNTVTELAAIGLEDPDLSDLDARVRALTGAQDA